jgi:hypothetical protein
MNWLDRKEGGGGGGGKLQNCMAKVRKRGMHEH